jgi:hypothetical protein
VRRLIGPGAPSLKFLLGVIGFTFFEVGAVVAASVFDGTFFESSPVKGLLHHYGILAILITNPLLIISVAAANFQYRRTLATLPVTADARKNIVRHLRPCRAALLGRGRAHELTYLFLVLFSILCWLINVQQSYDPKTFFGSDVFDSAKHLWGFISVKLLLFVTWVILYPIATFTTLWLTVASKRISTFLLTNKAARHLNVVHPDKSYGLRNLARLHSWLLAQFFIAAMVAFWVTVTHTKIYGLQEAPKTAALLVSLLLAILFIVVLIRPLASLVRQAHKQTFDELMLQVKRRIGPTDPQYLEFSLSRLCFLSVDRFFFTQGLRNLALAVGPVLSFVVSHLTV